MIWSTSKFRLVDGGYMPQETMIEGIDFIVITDHSRSEISMSPTRIEDRKRMINGTSRAYFTADKMKISTSWSQLPSRISTNPISFDSVTGAVVGGGDTCRYIVDDASAARDLIDWHRFHKGDFWVYLSFDTGSENDTLRKYAVEMRMFFENFSSSLKKRGGDVDLWDVSVSLEEV